jgi:hypothetical protein
VAALLLLMGLRAGDRTAGRLSRWRSRRGARASDALLAAVTFPGAFAWSLVRTLLIAPAALVAAAIAAVIAIIAVPNHPIPAACAFAAGMLVVFYGFGPGSGGSRRPIRGFFDAVADTPITAATAVIAMGAMVVAAIVVAASHPPFFWPAGGLSGWLGHFHAVSDMVHNIRIQVFRVIGRPTG